MERPVWPAGIAAGVRRLAEGRDAQHTLRALLETATLAAPRAVLFVVRRERVRVWDCFGYPADDAARLRDWSCAVGEGRVGNLARIDGPGADEDPAAFGETGPSTATVSIGRRVAVAGRPIAVLVAERRADERPWLPEALDLLATVAGLRLELSLAERRAAPGESETRGSHDHGVAENAALSPVVAPAEAPPELAAARRFARLVATDIRLYNEEAVVLGRRHGDLTDRLRDPLRRGIESFRDRHAELGDAGLRLLHEALVDVLAAGDAALLPSSALER